MSRQQLPPQIKKLDVMDRKTGKTVVRYQVTVDAGENPATGKRQQVRRRYASEKQARDALAEIADQASNGTFVPRTALTVGQVCEEYLTGRHNLRQTSSAKVAYDLGPLRERHGELPVQRLTKAHLDALIADLVAGGTQTAKGRCPQEVVVGVDQQGHGHLGDGAGRRPPAGVSATQCGRTHRSCLGAAQAD